MCIKCFLVQLEKITWYLKCSSAIPRCFLGWKKNLYEIFSQKAAEKQSCMEYDRQLFDVKFW